MSTFAKYTKQGSLYYIYILTEHDIYEREILKVIIESKLVPEAMSIYRLEYSRCTNLVPQAMSISQLEHSRCTNLVHRLCQ